MKRKWKTLSLAYIILIIVLTVVATGGSILIHRIEYIAGTRNDVDCSILYGFGLSVILFFFILLPIAASASILALVSLVLRHSNVGQVLLKLALMLLGPVIVCCAFLCTVPLSPIFLKGFEQWVVQEADIDAIQTWLASEGARHAGQLYSRYSKEGFPEELPECLVGLNPAFISFRDANSHNGPSVEIVWPYFMDEYGLVVGSPAMETRNEGRIKLDSSNYEFRRPVKRGVYVFIRG
ncbi:MAG: hypothetical protein ACYTEK_09805 [Planctomycetota bacterium]|jgi:hypothetical protein